MKKYLKSIFAFAVCVAAAASFTVSADADEVHLAQPVMLPFYVNGAEHTVQAVDAGYQFNTYLSLRSLAAALNGTEKQYSYTYVSDYFGAPAYIIRSGEAYSGSDGTLENQDEGVYLALKRYRIYADDIERKYYAYNYGDNDIFLSIADIQFMLGLKIRYSGGILSAETGEEYLADLPAMQANGRFESIRALAVGDVDTGEIIYSFNAKEPLPIASISKLMTYLILRESMDQGRIKTEDAVPVSETVLNLAKSENGMLPLENDTVLTVQELIEAMLVPSCNEATLALAELIAGDEASFVRMMNLKAKQLNLKSAEFLNCHGLPIYTQEAVPAKLQNKMSAEDLFELVSYLLMKYPDVTGITSKQYITLGSINYSMANSNPLVFNMTGITGMKTGTTDRAGYCLVATKDVSFSGETHTIAVVELGAETQTDRGQICETAIRWAENYYLSNGFAARQKK